MSFFGGHHKAAAPVPFSANDFMTIDGFKKWRETNAMPIAHIRGFETGMTLSDLWEDHVRHRLIQFNVIAFDGAAMDMTGYTAAVAGFLNHRKSNFAVAFVPKSKVEQFWKGWSDPAMRDRFAGRLMVCGFDLEADRDRYELVAAESSRLKSLPAECHNEYYGQRICFKATAGKTAISLGGEGGGVATAVTEACLKDGVAWQILALSRGKTETSATLLDWAYAHEGTPNVCFERGLDENEKKGFCTPPKDKQADAGVCGGCPHALPDWVPAACVVSLGVIIAIGFLRSRK